MRQSFSCLIILLLSSCGYRWQPEYPCETIPTVVIPYAQGDDDGTFTTEVIRTLSASGVANVQPHQGNYRLKIVLQNDQNQVIGYRKDKQKISGEITKNIVGTEGRRQMTAVVTLYENSSEKVAKGPYKISAYADYDYIDGDSIQDLAFTNSRGEFTTVLPFSLGQLEPIDSAQEAATVPLYQKLAQKIADTIFSAW